MFKEETPKEAGAWMGAFLGEGARSTDVSGETSVPAKAEDGPRNWEHE
jgi:hypothetical protein